MLSRSLIRSHRSLIHSLPTACLARALRCAHFFARSLTPNLMGKRPLSMEWTRWFHTVSTHCGLVSASLLNSQIMFTFLAHTGPRQAKLHPFIDIGYLSITYNIPFYYQYSPCPSPFPRPKNRKNEKKRENTVRMHIFISVFTIHVVPRLWLL